MKTLLQLITVLLSVVYVKILLENIATFDQQWEFLIIPISIVAIALSLNLMNLDQE